jgi:hypothetical protein
MTQGFNLTPERQRALDDAAGGPLVHVPGEGRKAGHWRSSWRGDAQTHRDVEVRALMRAGRLRQVKQADGTRRAEPV